MEDPSLAANLKIVALREKGLLLEKTGRAAEAAREYERALAAGDRTPGRYLALGNLYSATDPARSMEYLRKVVQARDASTAQKCSAEESLTYKHGWLFTSGFGKRAGEYDTGLFSLGFFFR